MADQALVGSLVGLQRGVQQAQSHAEAWQNHPLLSGTVHSDEKAGAVSQSSDPLPPLLLEVLGRRRRELFQFRNCPCCCPSQKMEGALQRTCMLLWHTQLLNVVASYGIFGRVQSRSSRAWSL